MFGLLSPIFLILRFLELLVANFAPPPPPIGSLLCAVCWVDRLMPTRFWPMGLVVMHAAHSCGWWIGVCDAGVPGSRLASSSLGNLLKICIYPAASELCSLHTKWYLYARASCKQPSCALSRPDRFIVLCMCWTNRMAPIRFWWMYYGRVVRHAAHSSG